MNESTFTKPCLTRIEAADYLSISVRLLDRLATEGRLPKVKIANKTVFRRIDLERYLEANLSVRTEIDRAR